jgi:hypothetical protein
VVEIPAELKSTVTGGYYIHVFIKDKPFKINVGDTILKDPPKIVILLDLVILLLSIDLRHFSGCKT